MKFDLETRENRTSRERIEFLLSFIDYDCCNESVEKKTIDLFLFYFRTVERDSIGEDAVCENRRIFCVTSSVELISGTNSATEKKLSEDFVFVNYLKNCELSKILTISLLNSLQFFLKKKSFKATTTVVQTRRFLNLNSVHFLCF